MKFYPCKYQKKAIDFILNNDKCAVMISIDMGKIEVALTAIQILKYDYFSVDKVLVITQKKMIPIWLKEMDKWEHLSILKGVSLNDKYGICQSGSTDIYFANIEYVCKLLNDKSWIFDVVIIDEISNYKNHKSKRFKNMLEVCKKVKRVIGLTSIPVVNGLEDLWSEVFLLDGGKRLGKYKIGFYERYYWISRIWYGNDFKYKRVLKDGAKEAIYNAISDIYLVVNKYDYIDVPKVTYQNVYVNMSSSEYSRYKFLEHEMILQLNEKNKITASNVAVLSSKLLQMANGMVYDDDKRIHRLHNRKLDMLEILINENRNENILVAYWFGHDKLSILERFKDARVIESIKDIDDWNNGKIKIGLMNPATGGEGIDMHTGSSKLIWYSLTWSLKLYELMNRRIINRLDNKHVKIIHIITSNTLDEKVIKILATKDECKDSLQKALYGLQGD